jgi:hypothetical protein
MKKIIFISLLFPVLLSGQNYLFEITPVGANFRLQITEDTREAYPRDVTDFGTIDTATLQAVAYQRIEQAWSIQGQRMTEAFLAELNAEQTENAIGQVVPLDYEAYASARFANAFDGNYQYQVRGTAVNFLVFIDGYELRRTSNNNLLGNIQPLSSNSLAITTTGATPETVNVYQFGIFWVGRNAADEIVILKRQ